VEISTDGELEIRRADTRLPLALWFGIATGGLLGRIAQFDRELFRLLPDAAPEGAP
jgi:hypothetical protein